MAAEFILVFFLLITWLCFGGAPQRAVTPTHWSKEGFMICVLAPDTHELIRNACGTTRPFEDGSYTSCYTWDWAPWVKARRRTAVPDAERKHLDTFLSSPGTLEGPATSYAVFPDASRHLIWSVVDKFGEGLTYFLVNPKKRDLDVIWLRKETLTKYFGPNAALLEQRKMGDWLPTVPFPGNPVDPLW